MKLKNFFCLMLGIKKAEISQKKQVPKIRRIKKGSNEEPTSISPEINEYLKFRNQIALALTRGIIIAFFISLVAVIYFGIADKEAPPILPQIISGTIGFFSGAITAFMRFPDTNKGK